ncbi:glycosyltransferase family 4 protein [Piscinibacter sakaiensis]|uniref:glycosyltransferase family 4 protein n=1 Tax=Piscinibacter sakaiensis TaxID=1547922 RepID=UPI003AACE7EF
MRIALVSQAYPPETAQGGIATQTHAKAHGLAALGHQVFVISHSIDGQRHLHHDGPVEVVRIPGFDSWMQIDSEAARWISYSLLVAAELADLQRRIAIDIIDFPEWGCEGYLHLLNRGSPRQPPVVLHLHGPLIMLAETIGWPEPESELCRTGLMMEATCLRLADAIVSSSRCSAQWAGKHGGIDAESIPVIHTGIDTDRYRPGLATRDPRPTIVFVGRVALSKGVDTLVDAACKVADRMPELRLRLIGGVGDGLRRQLLRRSAAAGHDELLEFAGFVTREALPRELCRGHLFAAPSQYEGGPGFVYLEAMACGLPVVGCSGSGSAEVIRDGETGRLVPPGDTDALAAVLFQLLDDGAGRRRLGDAARAYTLAEADWRVCIPRYAHFLQRVVETRR